MAELSDGRVVIIGASLAGLTAAESARRAGFSGHLTMVGAEPHLPYDRPPLSKHILTGEIALESTTLPQPADLDAEWRLGSAAKRLDRAARTVLLEDDTTVPYDRLLIATGCRARPWPNPRERALQGVYTLRDRDDSERLRNAMCERPERVVIIGGGFIGCEVAHAARARELPVTLIDRFAAPLARVLGEQLGSVVAARLEAIGVDLRLGAEVRRFEDDGKGHIIRVLLMDGQSFDTNCVVVALGAVRNTEWLLGSGLSFDDAGLDCDETGHALDEHGRPNAAIFVAGDVARFPHPLYARRLALEHWDHAVKQGAYVGMLLAGERADAPYGAVPAFWSAQGDFNIKSVGLTEGADGIVFAQGDPKTGRFVVVYGSEGRCTAAVAFDMARWLPVYADMIARRAPFPPIVGGIDQRPLTVIPPEFA